MEKMYDMAIKPKKNDNRLEVAGPMESSKEVRYPEIYEISSEQFPPVKDMKAGKETCVMMMVKPKRITIDSEGKVTCSMHITRMSMTDKSEMMKGDEKVDDLMKKMYPEKNNL